MAIDWLSLLGEDSLRSVLPSAQTHFARPVREGLSIFLGGLPMADQTAMLSAQMALPPPATISQRLGLLARSSPVLQKLGQILARDKRLAEELRCQFRELESLPPTVPLSVIQDILEQELGPLEARGVTLKPPAIAEASVAVVIPFQQEPSPSLDAQLCQGVFKVLKPGIEERLDRELRLLERVGLHLDEQCAALQIPHLDYQESFGQVRDKLWEEVQLESEQRHLVQARDFFADEPRVQVPALLDHCTARVTAMERVSGGKVTGHRLDSGYQRRRLAELVTTALIAKPMFSRSDQALFHSDPHAGNLFLTDDGRLAILDWSLVGRLGESERVAIVQVMLAAATLDGSRVVAVLEQLADRQRLDRRALKRVVKCWLRKIRRFQFPGLSWLIGMLDDATQSARLRVTGDLMLFRKSLHTLEGVVADVGASNGQLDKVLLAEFLRHFAREWPNRWFDLPQSRDCGTRLSNLDLTRTVLSSPATAARFWTGHAVDMLDAGARCWAAFRTSREPADGPGGLASGDLTSTVDREP